MIESLAFYIFAGLAVACSIGIVVSTNIVRTAVFLLGTLAAVAGLYFLLSANLLAAIQLIVYAGGTLVLIIFGVMLTSKSPWIKYDPSKGQIAAAALVAVGLVSGLSTLVLRADWSRGTELMVGGYSVKQAGRELLTNYLVPFEVASVLLLVVMIGAAYLARPEK